MPASPSPPENTPPPAPPAPPAPLWARAGSLVGAGTLAALLGAVPAAARVAPVAGSVAGGALGAWFALGACALVPVIAGVAFARGVREGAWSVAGGRAPLGIWAVATWAMGTFLALAAWGGVLRATTHHHGLAGVTFAVGGVGIGGVAALVARRLMHLARAADPWGRTALTASVVAVLACGVFALGIRVVRAGGAELPPVALVDALAFVIAAGALSRHSFARIPGLSVGGVPLALGVFGVGWLLLTHDPPLRDAIQTQAPLLAPMAALARPR